MNQVASLDQAILEINARTNSATFCSITVQGDTEAQSKVLMRQEEFDEERVRHLAASAFQYYPGQRVTLEVFNPNGSRKTLAKSYILQNPNTSTMGATPMYNQAPQQQQQNLFPTQPLPLDPMSAYLLNEKQNQIMRLDDQLREYRDREKILESALKAEKDKRYELEQTLKLNDREWDLKIRASELDKSGTSTLEGLGERAIALAEKHPPLAELLLTRLFGGATPAAPIAGVPTALDRIPAEARETVEELINILAVAGNEAIGQFYAVALLAKGGRINLSEIIAPFSNNN